MSDIKITLPGSETVTLTGQTIDKLIRAGDGDATLLYLYILKTNGQKNASEAAIALDKTKGWVASAMAVLSRLGLVELDTGDGSGSDTDSGMGSGSNTDSGDVYREPRQYTENDIKHELITGSGFSVVVDETQRRLGKILSPDDLLRLFGIYDNLRLPPEVILQLITHCINESRISGDGRTPNVRYIEKAAYTWEREGIFSLEKAEEYLKNLEAKKSIRGEIKKALQIRDREFSATEKRYVDEWISMGFEPKALAIAYDRTVLKTGKLTWAYMDSIVKNWNGKGIRTEEQVLAKDGIRKQGTGTSSNTGFNRDAGKHGEPNIEESERMQRLLNKIKED